MKFLINMIKTLKIALIWTILEPIWTILGIIFTILVSFLPYRFYWIYRKFDTKRTISVSASIKIYQSTFQNDTGHLPVSAGVCWASWRCKKVGQDLEFKGYSIWYWYYMWFARTNEDYCGDYHNNIYNLILNLYEFLLLGTE